MKKKKKLTGLWSDKEIGPLDLVVESKGNEIVEALGGEDIFDDQTPTGDGLAFPCHPRDVGEGQDVLSGRNQCWHSQALKLGERYIM